MNIVMGLGLKSSFGGGRGGRGSTQHNTTYILYYICRWEWFTQFDGLFELLKQIPE